MPLLAAPRASGGAPPPAAHTYAFAASRLRISGDAGSLGRVRGILRPQGPAPAAPRQPPTVAAAPDAPDSPQRATLRVDHLRSFLDAVESTLVLNGRVVLHKRGQLVVEATIEASLTWSLPERAELELGDGARVTVEIVKERSTGSGALQPGQTLRLVLRVPDSFEAASAVEVDELRIELSGATR